MSVGMTEASEASLAVASFMKHPDEGRQILYMAGRNLGRSREML